MTIIHYVVPVKAWRDTELHIAFEAPQDWARTTHQLSPPEGSQGLEYQTDLVSNDIFYIRTYPISRNQDQEYRDMFRKWEPAPVETTVTLNGITYTPRTKKQPHRAMKSRGSADPSNLFFC